MINWIHKLFHPHCVQCKAEQLAQNELDQEARVCQSCEVLKEQLNIANYEKDILLKSILNKNESNSSINQDESPEPIRRGAIPWRARRQMLEDEDRKKSELIKKSRETLESINSLNSNTDKIDEEGSKEIAKLEEEIGLTPEHGYSGGLNFSGESSISESNADILKNLG